MAGFLSLTLTLLLQAVCGMQVKKQATPRSVDTEPAGGQRTATPDSAELEPTRRGILDRMVDQTVPTQPEFTSVNAGGGREGGGRPSHTCGI